MAALRAALASSLLASLTACAHATATMATSTPWRAEPHTRFFLVGETPPELQVPTDLLVSVLASIRGGLGEQGHPTRTGFATRADAVSAARAAGCNGRCVVAVVRLIGLSTGGSFAARKLLTGAGDMHLELEAAFFDLDGRLLCLGRVDAQPYEDEASTQLLRHVVPTVGPAVADAIVGPR